MMTKEEIREIIACSGVDVASSIVHCGDCPYDGKCRIIQVPDCARILKLCNDNYIKELNNSQGENNMGIAEDMIKTLNKGESKMTTMLPDNTIQINPQGEIEGLDSLSLEDLVKLSAAAYKALEKRREEEQERLWNKVVEAVTNYTKQFGDIRVLLRDDADVRFDYKDMNTYGEIDCE